MALTYLWLENAEAHAQPLRTHLILTPEGDPVIENIHITEGEHYVNASADTAVWLHTREHTRLPIAVPWVAPLTRCHHTPSRRGTHGRGPARVDGQLDTGVMHPA